MSEVGILIPALNSSQDFGEDLMCKEAFGKCKRLKINHNVGQFDLSWSSFSVLCPPKSYKYFNEYLRLNPFPRSHSTLKAMQSLSSSRDVYSFKISACACDIFFSYYMISTLREESVLDIVFYSSLQIAHHDNFEFIM